MTTEELAAVVGVPHAVDAVLDTPSTRQGGRLEQVPGACGGDGRVIDVADCEVNSSEETAELPKSTVSTVPRPVPVRVTAVPPLSGPLDGAALVMVGGVMYVNVAEAAEFP